MWCSSACRVLYLFRDNRLIITMASIFFHTSSENGNRKCFNKTKRSLRNWTIRLRLVLILWIQVEWFGYQKSYLGNKGLLTNLKEETWYKIENMMRSVKWGTWGLHSVLSSKWDTQNKKMCPYSYNWQKQIHK